MIKSRSGASITSDEEETSSSSGTRSGRGQSPREGEEKSSAPVKPLPSLSREEEARYAVKALPRVPSREPSPRDDPLAPTPARSVVPSSQSQSPRHSPSSSPVPPRSEPESGVQPVRKPVPAPRPLSPRGAEGLQASTRAKMELLRRQADEPSAAPTAAAPSQQQQQHHHKRGKSLADVVRQEVDRRAPPSGASESSPGLLDSAPRKTAFGARVSQAAPQKKQSLANIFFMSSPLHGHAKRGDLAEIQKVVNVRKTALAPADYVAFMGSHANKNEQTALHVAVQHGHAEAALLLVQLGCPLGSIDVNGRSAVLYAARYGHTALLRDFWARCGAAAARDEVDSAGDSALHLAAANGHLDAVRFLCGPEAGCALDRPNKFGDTPLHKAARIDNLDMVELLLELGADPHAVGRDGKPHHVAQSAVVKELLKQSSVARAPPPAAAEASDKGEDEDDDDDSLELLPGVGKVISSHSSASSDLVHYKLRKALQKGSSFVGGEIQLSDEQLASHHETIRKKSSVDSSMSLFAPSPTSEGSRELAPPDPQAGVVVELTLASGMPPRPANVSYLFEPYRSMFAKRHYTYVSHSFGGALRAAAVMSVAAAPEGERHAGLLRSAEGYSPFSLAAEDVRAEQRPEDGVGARPLEEAIRLVLERTLVSMEDVLGASSVLSPQASKKLLSPTAPRIPAVAAVATPKLQHRLSMMRGSRARDEKAASAAVWQLVEQTSLPMELLALELKLNLPKTLTVGVVLMQPDQDEAMAMLSPMSKTLESFLSHFASPTETLGWSGYSGGMSTKESGRMFYSSWKGLEIVFHVAPLMSEGHRRQFVGNDKVLLYFLENWRPGKQLQPRFRGQVNTVAICVTPVAPPLYRLSAFHRVGMGDPKPALSDDPCSVDDPSFRDMFMSKLVNSHVEAYNLLYGDRMRRAWDEGVSELVDKYLGEGKKKKKRSLRRETRKMVSKGE